jgi:putative phosphoesterase
VRSAVGRLADEEVAHVLHAGDYVSPFVLKEVLKCPGDFVGVFGNNDRDKVLLSKVSAGRIHPGPYELRLPDHRILILHEPYVLEAIAASGLYDLVIFGHTHEAVVERKGRTLVVNPGELGGWLYGRATFAIYESLARILRE